VVHRDLKLENILLEDSGSDLLQIKLIDFGTARTFHRRSLDGNEKSRYLSEGVGTPSYMAPEILAKKSTSER